MRGREWLVVMLAGLGSVAGALTLAPARPVAADTALRYSGHVVDVLLTADLDLASLLPLDPSRFTIPGKVSNGGFVPIERDLAQFYQTVAENPFAGLHNTRVVRVIFDNPLSPYLAHELTIRDLAAVGGQELLDVTPELHPLPSGKRDCQGLIRLLEVVQVTPIGRRRPARGGGLDLLAGVCRPPRPDRPGDVDVVAGLGHRQPEVQRADGTLLAQDDLLGLDLPGGLERQQGRIARPPELFRAQPVARA